MIDLPLGLRNAIETQNCVLFVGAGIGEHFKKPDGNSAPNGNELCELLCEKFGIPYQPKCSLSQIAEIVEIRRGRKELETFVSSQLNSLKPDETFKWIASVHWRSIYTTNYDNCIERAYQLCSSPPQNPVSFSITPDIKSVHPLLDVPIYHIHGYFLSGDNPNIIITKSDYARFRERRKMLFEKLKIEMTNASILYVGYSNTDPNWEMLLAETFEEFFPSRLPQSFRVDPYADEIDSEILKSKNIHTIKCSFKDFVDSSLASSLGVSVGATVLDAVKKKVPPDLQASFATAPAPVTRLLASWEYINQAKFNETPNLTQFLKGDFPNWSLISEEQYFERDMQGDLYEAILDFATSPKSSTRAAAVLGSAGYGASTLIRILAIQIVKEGAGAVFFLNPGAQVIEGDIQYAASLFPNVFFVVDDAPEHASGLDRAIHLLRESHMRAMFILGGRLNEWHQRSSRPKVHEFPIDPLSDCEIYGLIDFLGKFGALNKLEQLPLDVQFAIVKERHHKELLVVMSESTENNNFDAIIESEYRGIGDSISRLAYLFVCCFYQHGAYVRDTLLAELLGINVTDLYVKISVPTEGVIAFDCIDGHKGTFGARARHHKIAAVVWERCTDSLQKEDIIQKTLRSLNLNFGSDVKAFDLFVRSDRIVDCIKTLEGRISFFEQACKMDPTSPYIPQHYARMLSRSGQHTLALNQIENAINNDRTVRVLYHTKGKILSELAIKENSIDIGRKYMIQAETCFNRGIILNNRDDYGFESLASLYFDWSKKLANIDKNEATDYLAKAEEVVSKGLRSVRNRESLWLLSAKMAHYLGQTPASLACLESAIRERPGAIIARYVLARAYRTQNEPSKALEILEPIIKSNADEFRALLEYSLALLDTGESYRKAAAVLQHGTLYGLSDSRFISVYGGVLFLDGDFAGADDIFYRAITNVIPGDELYKINFKPRNNLNLAEELKLDGEVITVKSGFSFIKPDFYPKIICPASKYSGTLMKQGLRVKFTLAFSAKGPVALFPVPI